MKVNALVIRNAEKYYRTAVQSDALSWNVRDEHMVEVINELINYHGEDAKIIVWEHNTHIGDASATDMKNEGMINVGQSFESKIKKKMYLLSDLAPIGEQSLQLTNGEFHLKRLKCHLQ